MDSNLVNWFEIPTTDINRAKSFYEKVFDIEVTIQDFEGTKMGWFPFDSKKPGVSGSLIQHESYNPSETHGPVIYFSSDDIEKTLKKVEVNGGKVMQSKTMISPEIGYMGVFIDCEGNRISLYTNAQV